MIKRKKDREREKERERINGIKKEIRLRDVEGDA